MDIFGSKILAMVALGLSSLLVGLLPSWLSSHSNRQWPLLLSILLCFGSGVLLSTSLVHMLPEVRISMDKYANYAEIVLCAGFFLVYIVDEIVHFFYGNSHDIQNHTENTNLVSTKRSLSVTFHSEPSYGTVDNHRSISHRSTGELRQLPYNPDFFAECADNNRPPSQLCHVGHEEPCDAVPITNAGLILALCIHSFMEGLAIGLQDSPSQVLLLLGAVASHKLVVGFCLGIELMSSSRNSFFCVFICVAVFSLGSVVGIGVGMVINVIPKTLLKIIFPIVTGLAAGTLLYVTLSEVLPRERARWHKQHHRRTAGLTQLLSVLIGFIFMTTITIFIDR